MSCPLCSPETFVDEQTVFIEGKPLGIPPMQAKIFDVLLSRKGRVTPHWIIWDAQWMDSWPEKAGNITRVQICLLKKALEKTGIKIDTVPQRGYVLTVQ